MEVTVTECEGIGVVMNASASRLDVKSVPEFKEATRTVRQRSDVVVLDLAGVAFIDSTGLGTLLSLLRGLTENGGTLRLCNLQSQVIAMFRLVRMSKVFDIYDTAAEALAASPGKAN